MENTSKNHQNRASAPLADLATCRFGYIFLIEFPSNFQSCYIVAKTTKSFILLLLEIMTKFRYMLYQVLTRAIPGEDTAK